MAAAGSALRVYPGKAVEESDMIDRWAIAPMLGAGLWLAAAAVGAAELPKFRQGLWEITDSGRPAPFQRCVDPTPDRQAYLEAQTRRGCSVSPATLDGAAYRFEVECPLGKTRLHSRYQITPDGDGAYLEEIDSSLDGGPKGLAPPPRQTIKAKRLGNCVE